MEPTPDPLPAGERGVDGVDVRARRATRTPSDAASPAERLEAGLEASGRWLRLVQDAVLVAVAVVMLLMGAFVLVDGVGELVGGVILHVEDGPAVVEVAENALLALILAELVGTILRSIGGEPLTVQPFLVIAIVAAIRHLLFVTVKGSGDAMMHTVELLLVGGLILLLVGALALLQTVGARGTAGPR